MWKCNTAVAAGSNNSDTAVAAGSNSSNTAVAAGSNSSNTAVAAGSNSSITAVAAVAANFQLVGFYPCKECCKRGPSSVASSLRTLGRSSSGPQALEGFKPLRSLVTPLETTI